MSADYCFDLVRRADKDRFLTTLFAPQEKRAALLALYAFNSEISRVSDVVSAPHIGLIRHQWWRDTLAAIYRGETLAHPVAEELAKAVVLGKLPASAFDAMITAREFDLYDDPMPDVASLEGYLGETSSALIQMASLVLVGSEAAKCAEAAGLAGVAHGLAALIRGGAPKFLPPGLDARAHARQRLAEARALRHTIPAAAFPAFLPVSLTEQYLGSTTSQFRRQLRLWWAARQETF